MAIKTHGNSNVDPSAPGGVVADNILDYDTLPKVLRTKLANAITALSALELKRILNERRKLNDLCKTRHDEVDYALKLIRDTVAATHDQAVKRQLVPRQFNFDIRRVREESPINVKRRERLEEAGQRRLRALRKRNSATGV